MRDLTQRFTERWDCRGHVFRENDKKAQITVFRKGGVLWEGGTSGSNLFYKINFVKNETDGGPLSIEKTELSKYRDRQGAQKLAPGRSL